MSVIDLLLDLFRSEESQQELADDPSAFLAENVPEGLTAEQVLEAMPGVCAVLPPEQAESLRTAYGLSAAGAAAGGGSGPSYDIDPQSGPAGPPPVDPGGDPVEQVLQQLNYYTNVVNTTNQTFEDNDVTNIDDSDTTVDASVNQNITAFGDVNQDFDNDVVSGDGAVAGGRQRSGQHRRRGRAGRRRHRGLQRRHRHGRGLGARRRHRRLDHRRRQPGDHRLQRRGRDLRRGRRHQRRRPRTPTWATASRSSAATTPTSTPARATSSPSTTRRSRSPSSAARATPSCRTTSTSTPRTAPVAFGAGSEADAQQQNVAIEDNYGQVQVAGDEPRRPSTSRTPRPSPTATTTSR